MDWRAGLLSAIVYDPVDVARQYRYVREVKGKDNTGQRVHGIQAWGGGFPGERYCCYYATMILDICFQGKSPIPRGGLCQDVHELAKEKGWLTHVAKVGCLYLFVNAAGIAHHIGIVTVISPLDGIAGNTSEDGTSSNGDGVHEHAIHTDTFVDYPRS